MTNFIVEIRPAVSIELRHQICELIEQHGYTVWAQGQRIDNSVCDINFETTKGERKMLIKVVHCKKEPYDIYIGRNSKWGNPFVIGLDGDREEVISKYEMHVMKNPKLINALPELIGKTLGCWCKPEACHGDILKIMVEDELWLK